MIQDRCFWDIISTESTVAIFEHLPLRGQIHLAQTCKRLYEISFAPSIVELQTHRFFVSFAHKQEMPLKIAQSVRILTFSSTIGNLATYQLLIERVGKLQHLTALSLKKACLVELGPEAITLLNRAMGQMKNLKLLDLSENHMKEKEMEVISAGLKNLSSLTSLNLRRNFLKDKALIVFRRSLLHLSSLTDLDLGHTELGNKGVEEIGRAFSSVRNLRTLYLDANHLTDACAQAILRFLEHLGSLRYLNLSLNAFRKRGVVLLESGFAQRPSLKVAMEGVFDLQEHSGKDLEGMKLLTQLRISAIPLEQAHVLQNIAEALCQMPNLRHLSLTRCGLESLEVLLENPNWMRSITGLDLSNNTMYGLDLTKLKHMKSLTNLNLNFIDGGIEANGLCEALMQMPNLRVLYLRSFILGVEGTILEKAFSQLSRLEELSLAIVAVEGVQNMTRAVAQLSTLKNLSLHFYLERKMILAEAHSLASALMYMKMLLSLTLDFANNQDKDLCLEEEASRVLAQALLQLKQLKQFRLTTVQRSAYSASRRIASELLLPAVQDMLYLRNLEISPLLKGAGVLAFLGDSLTSLSYLEELRLTFMGLEEVLVLAKSLKGLPSLKTLCLSHSKMGERGSNTIAQALPCLTVLEDLSLCDCEITDEGIEVLAKGVAALFYLKRLMLSRNQIRRKGVLALAHSFKDKLHLQMVNLSENPVDKEDLRIVWDVLDRKMDTFYHPEGVIFL